MIPFKKPKITKNDLDKINSTIKDIKECPYCKDLKEQIKKCMESHVVKNNLKSVTWHNIKCEKCRSNILLITEHTKRGHN